MKWATTIFAGVLAAVALAGFSASAQDADPIEEAHETVRKDTSLQFEFSETEPLEPPPSWLVDFFDFIAGIFRSLGPVINFVFWVGLILICAAIAFLVGRYFWRQYTGDRSSDKADPAPELYRPAPAFVRSLLEDADRLAREGDYAAAVHVILFRSIEDIQQRRPHSVRESFTSREIAGLDILPTLARREFSNIAATVERSRFAGKNIDAALFAQCRASYVSFADAEGWA